MIFENQKDALVCRHLGETLKIEAWGKDSFRVRATMLSTFTENVWALTETTEKCDVQITIGEEDHWTGDGTIDKKEIATIVNGRLKAVVNFAGVISFYRDHKLILREYFRNYDGTLSRERRTLKLVGRQWKGIIGGSENALKLKFEKQCS